MQRNNTQELAIIDEIFDKESVKKCMQIVDNVLDQNKCELRRDKLTNNLKSEMKIIYAQTQNLLRNNENDTKKCKNFNRFVENANYHKLSHVFYRFVIELTNLTEFNKIIDEELTKYLEFGPISDLGSRLSQIFNPYEIQQIEQLKK